jgi:hypothetical protein
MSDNTSQSMVEIPIQLFAELVETRTMLDIIKKETVVSKYSVEREFIAKITGITLPAKEGEGGPF